MINKMYINCDRYITTMIMMIITTLTPKKINIIISKNIKRHKYVEISGYVISSFGVTCALLMRPYINRFFFRNTLKVI